MAFEGDYWAVVPAAGIGSRMQAAVPKQYLLLNGRPVISCTLSVLLSCSRIKGIVVAVSEDDSAWPEIKESRDERVYTVTGGDSRADSVLSALQFLCSLADKNDRVLVHDAARPCLSLKSLDDLLFQLESSDAPGAILAVPVHDTMKRSDPQNLILQTVDRAELWHAQTPQVFGLQTLADAIEAGLKNGLAITDEASAIEAMGLQPLLVEGRSDNIKITRPTDLALAEFFLSRLSGNT